MSEQRVIPFEDLSETDRKRFATQANWMMGDRGDWKKIKDTRYGTVEHVVVEGKNGEMFDKLNIKWSPAVFVVALRVNPQNKAEFLLSRERRILLRDDKGEQGNVEINNIPQGLIKVWKNETPAQAAQREVLEETGYAPTDLVQIRSVYIDAANSESEMPFFLALVPYKQESSGQQLEETESIQPIWYSWKQIPQLGLKDVKTLAGLATVQETLNPAIF